MRPGRAGLRAARACLKVCGARGLAVRGRAIYAVQDAGVTRLPCVRIAHLGPLSRMSGGHLPELADAAVKPAPMRKRRR